MKRRNVSMNRTSDSLARTTSLPVPGPPAARTENCIDPTHDKIASIISADPTPEPAAVPATGRVVATSTPAVPRHSEKVRPSYRAVGY